MSSFALYNETGAIESIFKGPGVSQAESQGKLFAPCDSDVLDTTHFVSTSTGEAVITAKLSRDKAYSNSGFFVVFSSLPSGTQVSVNEETVVTDDQPTEIEFELPGTYTVKLSGLVEYLDETLEVTVG